MRLAVVTQDSVGGVGTIARWLASGVRAAGHNVDVIQLAESRRDPLSRRILAPSTWLTGARSCLSEDGQHSAWGADWVEVEFQRYMPRPKLTATLNSYDLVQIVSGSPALAYVARDVGSPVCVQAATRIAWERERVSAGGSRVQFAARKAMTRIVSRLETRALLKASVAFLENQNMIAYARSVGQRNAIFAPPGTDVSLFSPPVNYANTGPIVSVCRLNEPRKGLENVVRAYTLLATRRKNSPDLVIAGRGQLYEVARSALEASPVRDRISIAQDVPKDALPHLYGAASVFVQGSYEEGLGLASIEAMACGLPVASTATDGSRCVIEEGVTGHLVRVSDDPASIAHDLAMALERCLDRGSSMGEAARQRAVEVFSSEACLGTFLEHYRHLV